MSEKSLFEPITEAGKLHPSFQIIRNFKGNESARRMLMDIYRDFEDPEGNFLEQFQTSGFDSRFFELYLFAYFSRSGFTIDRTNPNPDFLVSRGDTTVAIEATTVNPSKSGVIKKFGKKIEELSQNEIRQYQQEELPIRLGSPLFSKLNKKYWELDHCKNKPLVIAIEAFHDEESLLFSDNALLQYLYGLRWSWGYSSRGTPIIKTSQIQEHNLGAKIIPSYFFGQKDTEFISAILFSNSGTKAKFDRMGYQTGYGCEVINITRMGTCYNPNPEAMDPTFFSYNLDEPPIVETWGQGLVTLHNPNCLYPFPRDFFVDAVQTYVEDGEVQSDTPGWHPIASNTYIFHLGEMKKELEKINIRKPRISILAISKDEFRSIYNFFHRDSEELFEEQGWFVDESQSFLGIIIHELTTNRFSSLIFARDECFQFHEIIRHQGYITREESVGNLYTQMVELLSHPKRIFPK